MRLDLGIFVNNRAPLFLGAEYTLAHLLDAAVLCEELGFHAVWVGDSVLAKPRYRPIPVLAAIAARTRRIRLGAGILQPQLYNNPVMLALEWATLDTIASGRTIFGVGIGAGVPDEVEREHAACGVSKRSRGRAFEETVELVKRLWVEDEVSCSGGLYRLDRVSLGYRPVQRPHPPIWIAAGTGGPIERVARLADAWFTIRCTPDEFAQTYQRIRETARTKYGRDPDRIGSAMTFFINVDPDREAASAEARWFFGRYLGQDIDEPSLDRFAILGPPDRCVERIEAYAAAGVKALSLVIASRDQMGQITTIAKEILPAFA